MKRIFNISLILMFVFTISGCKKGYLDINDDPNSATSSTPKLVLPAVLNNITSNFMTYFNYGAWMVGYQANAGGYSYVGSGTITYNFNNGSNTGIFSAIYSDGRSLQYIINTTEGQQENVLFNSVARIMKANYFQMGVDEYGDMPYSEALKGADIVTPKYDKGEDIYKDLVVELDAAIAQLKQFGSSSSVVPLGNADIFFGGNATKWIKFANNIKLRILLRAQKGPLASWATAGMSTFSSEGFLLEDAVSQPGYVSTAARQNPIWNSFQSSYTGTAAGQSVIPTTWMYTFYDGVKISDQARGTLMYRTFNAATKVKGQLGLDNNIAWGGAPNWYVGTGTGTSSTDAKGVTKSRTFGMLMFPASQAYFQIAEANLNGYLTAYGTAKENFEKGIKASYDYLNKSGNSTASAPEATLNAYLTTYKADNATNYLVNYDLATTNEQRLEAIITQKYIALNWINGYEAWQEYKRTGYPKVSGRDATTTFASTESVGTTPDRLPVRLLYPTNEYNLNTANVPAQGSINIWTSKIFWDVN